MVLSVYLTLEPVISPEKRNEECVSSERSTHLKIYILYLDLCILTLPVVVDSTNTWGSEQHQKLFNPCPPFDPSHLLSALDTSVCHHTLDSFGGQQGGHRIALLDLPADLQQALQTAKNGKMDKGGILGTLQSPFLS